MWRTENGRCWPSERSEAPLRPQSAAAAGTKLGRSFPRVATCVPTWSSPGIRSGDMRFAREHGFAIVTKDADFEDLALALGYRSKVVWIRRGNCSVEEVENLLRQQIRRYFGVWRRPPGPYAGVALGDVKTSRYMGPAAPPAFLAEPDDLRPAGAAGRAAAAGHSAPEGRTARRRRLRLRSTAPPARRRRCCDLIRRGLRTWTTEVQLPLIRASGAASPA